MGLTLAEWVRPMLATIVTNHLMETALRAVDLRADSLDELHGIGIRCP
jgi:hypothetical protein